MVLRVSNDMKFKNYKLQGFSLIEVVVFIGVFGIFFVSATTISLTTLRNSRIAQERMIANRVAQETMDFVQSIKETDWDAFSQIPSAAVTNGQVCSANIRLDCRINSGGIDNTVNMLHNCFYSTYTPGGIGFSCNKNISNVQYTPYITFQNTANQYQKNVTVTVSWIEMGKTNQISLVKQFTPYEK